MPKYRVSGSVIVDFLHEIEAESEDDAMDKVEALHMDQLDDYTVQGNEIDYAVEIDEDGEEVESSEDSEDED